MFANVGGTYFFLVGTLNFLARLINMVLTRGVKFMNRKTKPHVKRIYAYSVSKRKRGATNDKDSQSDDDELLGDEDDGVLQSISDENISNRNNSER